MSSSAPRLNGQASSFHKVPKSAMMRDYLANGPATATERLVAGAGGFGLSGTSTSTPATSEELRLKAAYLDRLVKQTQSGGNNRDSTSSTSTA